MNFTALRDLLAKRPFEPFRVFMSNGEVYDARHLEFAAASRPYLFIDLDNADESKQQVAFLSYGHIVKIEPIAGQAAA